MIYGIYKSTINDTALIYAAEKGHKEIVEILLKQEGIDVNIRGISNHKYS